MEDLRPRARSVVGAAALAALAAASLLLGCGGSEAEKGVSSSVHTYLNRVADGQADQACRSIAPGALARMRLAFRGFDCPALVRRTRNTIGASVANLKEADVRVLSLEGDAARVRVYLNSRRVEARLIRRDGTWTIDRFDLVSSLYGLNQ